MNESTRVFVGPVISFTVSLLIFPVLIKLLTKWQVFDEVVAHKIHKSFTPSMGGIAIFGGLIVSLLIVLPFSEWVSQKYFFIAIGIMFFVGLRDDVLTLSPLEKLVGQILPILILLLFGGLSLSFSIFNFELGELPGWFLIICTLAVVIVITNSYNLIDGLDGLAGTIGLVSLSWFAVWFLLVEQYSLSLIAFCTAGALLAFLLFNWQPSKIFMGDTGALVVGLVISIYSLLFLNHNSSLPAGHAAKFASSFGAMASVLIVPFLDTVRIIILRLSKGSSPFKGDKNHVHHQLLKIGFSHSKSVVILLLINLLFILLSISMRRLGDLLVVPTIVVLSILISFVLQKMQRNAKGNLISI